MDMCTDSEGVYPKGSTNPGSGAPWPATASELGQCTALVLGLSALLFGAALFAGHLIGALLSYAAMLTQLWAPMARADRVRVGLWALGLHRSGWLRHLGRAAAIACVMLPVWALALWWGEAHWRQWGLLPAGGGPPHAGPLVGLWPTAEWLSSQLLGIALPEEVFWRGYVQPAAQGAWSRRTGRPCGLFNGGTAVATALFALGHVVGGAGPASVATVFPGLVFAVLRNRDESLVGPVALHFACNVAAALALQTFF